MKQPPSLTQDTGQSRPPITVEQLWYAYDKTEPFGAYIKRRYKELNIRPRRRREFEALDPELKFFYRAYVTGTELRARKAPYRVWNATLPITSKFRHLEEQAAQGSLLALEELVSYAIHATTSLNDLAGRYPRFVGLLAKNIVRWPVLAKASRSKYPHDYEFLKAIRLDLGRYDCVEVARLKSDPTAATKWALKLIKTIDKCRRNWLAGAQRLSRKCSYVWHDEDGKEIRYTNVKSLHMYRRVYGKCFDEARGLPPLNKASAPDWWEIAKRLFLKDTSNRPWEVEELKRYAQVSEVIYEPLKKVESKKRAAIVKQIRQAFFILAPYEESSPSSNEYWLPLG
jgi:hypothetical protein